MALDPEQLKRLAAGVGSSTGGAIGTLAGPVGSIAGSAIGSTAGALLSSIPALIKTDAEKENAKRLAKLKRMSELGTLGFTEEEKQALYNAGTSSTEKAAADVRALQSGTAAALGTGAGQAALANQAQQESLQNARASLERDLQAKNLEEKRALEQEMEDRQAIASEAKSRQIAAGVSIATGGLASIDEELEKVKTVRGSKPSSAQLESLSKMTGIPAAKLGPTLEYFATASPEMQQLFGQLLSPGSTGVISPYPSLDPNRNLTPKQQGR